MSTPFGYEAPNEGRRRRVTDGRRRPLGDNTRAVEAAKRAKRAKLKVKGLMSCGRPGESAESIASMRDWLISVDIDDFDCTIITPYPGAPYYDEAVQSAADGNVWTYSAPITSDRLHSYEVNYFNDLQYYKSNPDGYYQSFVYTDFLKAEDILRMRGRVETEVRSKLKIPFNAARPAQRFEHSMGQGFPASIKKSSVAGADTAGVPQAA